MQIRLTVVDPLGPAPQQRGRAARRDVLVTAPAGTALADVASALAAAVAGDAGGAHERGREGGGAVALYAGAERLDGRRRTLGEPPLTDGAVLFLGAPGEPEAHPETNDTPAQLHVVAGPDAGGVHLLHGGRIRVGRSADADVPLDDPDVSRLHCAITVEPDGRVSVADLDSTNGTLLDGTRVGPQAVRFPAGALLRLGESALRLAPPGGPGARAATAPDGEGHVRLSPRTPAADPAATARSAATDSPAPASGSGSAGPAPGTRARVPHQSAAPAAPVSPAVTAAPADGTHEAHGAAGWGARGRGPGEPPVVPGRGHAPRAGSGGGSGSTGAADAARRGGSTRTGGLPGPRTGGEHGAGAHGAEAAGGGRDTHAQGRWITDEDLGPYGRGAAPEDAPPGRGRGAAGRAAGSHPEDRTGGTYAPGTAGQGFTEEDGDTRAQRRRTAGGEVRTPGREAAQGGAGSPDGRAPGADPRTRDRLGTGPHTGTAPHHHGTPDTGVRPYDDRTDPDPDPRAHGRGTAGPHAAAGGPPVTRATGPSGAGRGGRADAGHGPGTPAQDRVAGYDGVRPPGRPAPGGDAPAQGGHVPGTADGPAPAPGGGGPATDASHTARKRGGLSAWARRLAGGKGAPAHGTDGTGAGSAAADAVRAQQPETWPDPAALLLTALGPGPRLWERGTGHPEALTVRLGTADRTAPDGAGLLPSVPVTAALREAGALGLAGPRPRLAGLARSVLAQLTALHSPEVLEVVLLSTDRARPVEERTAEWSWLGWLPHLRPARGQDCRLLVAYDREQAAARTDELLRRLNGRTARDIPDPHGTRDGRGTPDTWGTRGTRDVPGAPAEAFPGPYSVLVVDGDPGGADVREAVERLALEGPAAGIHVLCLAETGPAPLASPVTETYAAACAVSGPFRACGAVALLGGDVATALHLVRVAHGAPVGPGTVAAVDAVSSAWAERFARALAPLRTDAAQGGPHPRASAPLPPSARLLDELGLARATPASLLARWADAADDTGSPGGRARAVLGAGPRGPLSADLVADGPHLLIEGPPGSGRTELLRAVVASLASAERPDRLAVVLVDGRDGTGAPGGPGGAHSPHSPHGAHGSHGAHGPTGPGDGLGVCTDVPHATTHLTANDPVRMREFAQSLTAELKRRAELLGRTDFAEWHTRVRPEPPGRIVPQRTAGGRATGTATAASASASLPPADGDLESPPSTTLRLRPPSAARQTEAAPPLPRLVVVVDDLDALVSPALGSPGRPAAGSVLRALDAVAREGERLGVHLVVAAAPGSRTADTEPARRATLRVTLDAPPAHRTSTADPRGQEPGDEPAPGRGRLTFPDGRVTAFQGGRVTGRIPRTATLRPTVVALEWQRMGDPPARRQVRELGNGPTDLALLASALERAARSVTAPEVPSLL